MSNGDKTLGGRVLTVEALMQERKEDTAMWRSTVEKRFNGTDEKLDELLRNGKNLITIGVLEDAFTTHVSSCPGRTMAHNPSNPGPKDSDDKNSNGEKIDLILRGYRGLGIVGSMMALNAMLILVVLKLTHVF